MEDHSKELLKMMREMGRVSNSAFAAVFTFFPLQEYFVGQTETVSRATGKMEEGEAPAG